MYSYPFNPIRDKRDGVEFNMPYFRFFLAEAFLARVGVLGLLRLVTVGVAAGADVATGASAGLLKASLTGK